MQLNPQQIHQISRIIGTDLTQFDPKELAMGMEVEQEHQDITNGHPVLTARIALAHLKEDPAYYTHLKEMEDKYAKTDEEQATPTQPTPAVTPPVAPRRVPLKLAAASPSKAIQAPLRMQGRQQRP